LNKEIKRRADVVEIFPNPAAFPRLATAVVIEAHAAGSCPRCSSGSASTSSVDKTR
jgi:transposase-like protein